MNNNDVMRSLRYTFRLNDFHLAKIFELAEFEVDSAKVENMLKKEDDPGFIKCNDKTLAAFLDGFIIFKRGKQEARPTTPAPEKPNRLTNNMVLKKIRIALKFQEKEMIGTMKLVGMDLSKSELTALFRKEGHKHYRECGDQFLRNFLQGLTRKFRG